MGQFKVEWTAGVKNINNQLIWNSTNEVWGWNEIWPKAIKFTFTLYDSKGIIKGGRTFTHIVYLEN